MHAVRAVSLSGSSISVVQVFEARQRLDDDAPPTQTEVASHAATTDNAKWAMKNKTSYFPLYWFVCNGAPNGIGIFTLSPIIMEVENGCF